MTYLCLEYYINNEFDRMANKTAGKTRADFTIIETAVICTICFLENSCLNI